MTPRNPGLRATTTAQVVAAMVAPMATPPQLSPEQRTAALAKAAEARTARAELKNRLKLGSLSLPEALASNDS